MVMNDVILNDLHVGFGLNYKWDRKPYHQYFFMNIQYSQYHTRRTYTIVLQKKITHQNNTDYQNLNNSSNFAQKEISS